MLYLARQSLEKVKLILGGKAMGRVPSDPTRALIASIAAHERWANCSDRTEATAPARRAFRDRFIRQARERYGDLPEAELHQRAESLRAAHYRRMALRSAQARRRRAEGGGAA